jgi:hypothetical protein
VKQTETELPALAKEKCVERKTLGKTFNMLTKEGMTLDKGEEEKENEKVMKVNKQKRKKTKKHDLLNVNSTVPLESLVPIQNPVQVKVHALAAESKKPAAIAEEATQMPFYPPHYMFPPYMQQPWQRAGMPPTPTPWESYNFGYSGPPSLACGDPRYDPYIVAPWMRPQGSPMQTDAGQTVQETRKPCVAAQATATERKEKVEVEDEQPEPKVQLARVRATARAPEEPTTFRVESNAMASEDIEWSVPFTFDSCYTFPVKCAPGEAAKPKSEETSPFK